MLDELFNTGKFRVLERAKMKEILKEQGFQQTGCVSTAWVVNFDYGYCSYYHINIDFYIRPVRSDLD
ncbi:hypothetical protein GWN26_14740 [Candidatus Saccharibacteria bacterium]|nr:hypothetical protein [Calditrichia bacterium]NIV73038.1 hypothetical protein [Calditrichia bacterium]NIW00301.1 hypothetical protein [Candidatus Saccharibacteria bacterium]